MQFVSTRIGRVAYESTGHGPPLVLLHSGGHDHHDFDAIVPRLAARYRTLAVDLPGHGDSDSLREHTRAALLCEAVEELFDALALRDAVLVGNSVGGMAALRVALRWPERVRGLVLASTSGLVQQSALLRALCWVHGRELVRRWTGRAFTRAYLRARNEHVAALLARQEAARAA